MPSSSNTVIDRFFPIVIAPQPPTLWMRTAIEPGGERSRSPADGSDRSARCG
jgi:hypothetical protein